MKQLKKKKHDLYFLNKMKFAKQYPHGQVNEDNLLAMP